jgi:exopolysaccharide biosynthesis polyprenyl glycosylphosphotransferase
MLHPSKSIARRIYAVVNASVVLLLLLGAFIGVNWAQMPDGFGAFLAIRVTVKNIIVSVLFLLAWVITFRIFGLTKLSPTFSLRKELIQVTKACAVASIVALLFPLTSRSGAFSNRVLLYFLPVAIVACLCGHVAARTLAGRLYRAVARRRDVIIVGSGPRAASLYERVLQNDHGDIRVLGFVDSPNGHSIPSGVRSQMLGVLENLERILMSHPVDEVLIALPAKSCYDQIQSTIQTCERAGVEAKYLSDVFEVSLAKPRFEADEETPVISLKVVQDDYRLVVKRGIDIFGAVAGLTLFGPLMLVIAAAIKLTSAGPAIFTQERYGLNRRRFRMYKFRTMVANAEELQATLEAQNEADGPVFKIRNDPRVTPLGNLLRKTSLDEFPQFLNVLRGEMSLVGPRPLPKRDVARFDDASLMRRFSVKPGLTCLWQINGRSNTSFVRWLELDLKYIDTWSLRLDLMILVQTVPAVFRGQGAA